MLIDDLCQYVVALLLILVHIYFWRKRLLASRKRANFVPPAPRPFYMGITGMPGMAGIKPELCS